VPGFVEFDFLFFVNRWKPVLVEDHIESFSVNLIDDLPLIFARIHFCHSGSIASAPVIGELIPVGFDSVLCTDFGCLSRYRTTPIDDRAEHVEYQSFDLAIGHLVLPAIVISLI